MMNGEHQGEGQKKMLGSPVVSRQSYCSFVLSIASHPLDHENVSGNNLSPRRSSISFSVRVLLSLLSIQIYGPWELQSELQVEEV